MIDKLILLIVALALLFVAGKAIGVVCDAIDVVAGELAVALGLPYAVGSVGWHLAFGTLVAGTIAVFFIPPAPMKLLVALVGGPALGMIFAAFC